MPLTIFCICKFSAADVLAALWNLTDMRVEAVVCVPRLIEEHFVVWTGFRKKKIAKKVRHAALAFIVIVNPDFFYFIIF